MKTFRQELINYYDQLKRLDWLQDQTNKLRLELAKSALMICNHPDVCKGQALLVQPESKSEIENGAEPFTVFIAQAEDWSRKDYTHNLKLQALTEIKTPRSRPDVGSTPDSLEETT